MRKLLPGRHTSIWHSNQLRKLQLQWSSGVSDGIGQAGPRSNLFAASAAETAAAKEAEWVEKKTKANSFFPTAEVCQARKTVNGHRICFRAKLVSPSPLFFSFRCFSSYLSAPIEVINYQFVLINECVETCNWEKKQNQKNKTSSFCVYWQMFASIMMGWYRLNWLLIAMGSSVWYFHKFLLIKSVVYA